MNHLAPALKSDPKSFMARLKSPRTQETIWSTLFVLPMVVMILLFTVYPNYRSVVIAFYNWSGFGKAEQFVGFRHFVDLIKDPWFWNAFRHSLQYTVVLVPVQLGLALILAVVLNNPRLRLRTFYRTLYFLPYVCNAAISAVVFNMLFRSFTKPLSALFGINPPVNPIGSAQLAMWTVIVFGIWASFGINFVMFLSAIQSVPTDLYDAARVDGANWLQEIIHVTLPSIRPLATVMIFFATLGSLGVFTEVLVLTGGGPYYASDVVQLYIYSKAFGISGSMGGSISTGNMGFASAASLVMNLLVLGVTGIFYLARRKKEN